MGTETERRGARVRIGVVAKGRRRSRVEGRVGGMEEARTVRIRRLGHARVCHDQSRSRKVWYRREKTFSFFDALVIL